MLGTFFNVAGILAGGAVGLIWRKPLSRATEAYVQIALAVLTIYFGLRLTWQSLDGGLVQMLRQLGIVVLALMLGKLTGQLLGLQKISNGLGRRARDWMAAAKSGDPNRASLGFKTCAVLFCAAPLGILGAVQDGLSGYFYSLVIKATIDGLTAFSLTSLFGASVMLSALPVPSLQGTISLGCSLLAASLAAHGVLNSIQAAGGLLVFSVALVMLGVKRIHFANYLPSLLFAALLSWLWR